MMTKTSLQNVRNTLKLAMQKVHQWNSAGRHSNNATTNKIVTGANTDINGTIIAPTQEVGGAGSSLHALNCKDRLAMGWR
jgi:hypothetical protein